MITIDPNAPAFARDYVAGLSPQPGISTRTYLAGLAMQGLCATHGYHGDPITIANNAVAKADALITALNKTS